MKKFKLKLYDHIFEFTPGIEGFVLLSFEALAKSCSVPEFFDTMRRFQVSLTSDDGLFIENGEPVPGKWDPYIYDLVKENKNDNRTS